MFGNSGKKLKIISVYIKSVGAVLSVVSAGLIIYGLFETLKILAVFIGIFELVIGLAMTYLISVWICAFGELVDNSARIADALEKNDSSGTKNIEIEPIEIRLKKKQRNGQEKKNNTDPTDFFVNCRRCGKPINELPCPYCGNKSSSRFKCNECGRIVDKVPCPICGNEDLEIQLK